MVSFSVRAAAVLALVSCIQAKNVAVVINHCSAPVYLWSVGDTSSEMFTVAPHGMPYYEQFQTREYGGQVIKIATDPNEENITQFEYTYQPSMAVWYDLSNINGHPFTEGGMNLAPNIGAEASCQTLSCPPGVQPCDDAYNNPDDVDTHACPDGIDLTLVLCPESSDTTAKREVTPESGVHARGAKHLHAHQRRTRRGAIGVHA